jgi:hypothetical protein
VDKGRKKREEGIRKREKGGEALIGSQAMVEGDAWWLGRAR